MLTCLLNTDIKLLFGVQFNCCFYLKRQVVQLICSFVTPRSRAHLTNCEFCEDSCLIGWNFLPFGHAVRSRVLVSEAVWWQARM